MPNKPVDINTNTKPCKICGEDSMPGSKKCSFHARTRDDKIAREQGAFE